MCIHLTIDEVIFDSFCVFPLEHFDVYLNVFTAFILVQYCLCTNKTQGKQYNRFHPRIGNKKPMKTL